MPEVGMEGQLKLKQAKVLCIGTGGLGAPLGLYLAAAGVGRIGLVDFDTVDFTNLQRQVLFGTSDVGRPKIEAAADRLRDLNPDDSDRHVRDAPHQRKRARSFQGLRHHRRRHRQFPHALSGERRVRAARQAQRVRLDFPLRRPDHRFRLSRRPVLSLLVSRTAPAGPCAVVRRRRRARRAARNRRHDPGSRNAEAHHRQGRAARSAGCCCLTRSAMKFRELKLRKNPDCPRLRRRIPPSQN